MTDTWVDLEASSSRLDRWLAGLPLASFCLGAAVLAGIVGAYLVSAALAGQLDALRRPDGMLGLARPVRYDFVLAALVAYTIGVGRFGRRRTYADLADLRGLLRPSPALDLLLRNARRGGGHGQAASMLAGALFGLSLELITRATLRDGSEISQLSPFFQVWGVGLGMTLFALLGRMTFVSIRSARALSRLGRHHTEIQLLEPDPREIFARFGVRAAAFWFVGSSIASLLTLEAVAPWLVLVVIAMTLTIGILALLLPARGIHQAVHEAKQGELAWVRRAIVGERETLVRGDAPERAARLPALLSYEARIEAVREWPFDTQLLLRFSLFLLLPLGSWVGGALVERLVDAALG